MASSLKIIGIVLIIIAAVISLGLSIASFVLSITSDSPIAAATSNTNSSSTPSGNTGTGTGSTVTGYGTPTTVPPDSGWLEVSNYLNQSIDVSINPCHDAFKFACGGWISKYATNTNQTVSVTQLARDKTTSIVQEGLESLNPVETTPVFFKKVLAAYNQCIKGSDANNSGFLKLIDSLNSWPLLNPNWNVSCGLIIDGACQVFDIGAFVGRLQRQHGVSSLFWSSVEPDWRNSTNNVLHLHQGKLFLGSAQNYLNAKFVTKRTKYIEGVKNIAMVLAKEGHMTLTNQQAVFAAAKVVHFETQVAKIVIAPEDDRNPVQMYNPMTKAQLKSAWPNINWDRYFSQIIPLEQLTQMKDYKMWMPSTQDYQILPEFNSWPDQNTVVVHEPKYFDALNTMLNNSITSPKNLQNYLFWRFLVDAVFYVNSPNIRSTLGSLWSIRNDGSDSNGLPLPKSACTQLIQHTFPLLVGRIYLDQIHLDEATIQQVTVMSSNILKTFSSMVDALEWMDDKTKVLTKDKLNNIVLNVGYPSITFNNTALNEYVDGLNLTLLTTVDPLSALETIAQFKHDKWLNKLTSPVDRHDFGFCKGPEQANAWYDPALNSITLPASILQPPYFKLDFPKYYNYGWLGSIIGRAMGHAFDDIGIEFWLNGNLSHWLDQPAITGYDSIMQCLETEYNQFCVVNTSVCLDGNSTLAESIADAIGTNAAYNAYLIYEATHGTENSLPGWIFNNKQLYFLTLLQQYCSYSTKDSLISSIILDPLHTPDKMRAVGNVFNEPAYGQLFGCTQGTDPMYPLQNHVCTVF